MVRTGVSAVIVGEGLAIVTQRDLVGAIARGRPVGDAAMNVATMQPLTIRTASSALDALAAMVRYEVHHLVVVDADGVPVGGVALGAMAEVVLGDSGVPHWLTAFRLALRSDSFVRGEWSDNYPPGSPSGF